MHQSEADQLAAVANQERKANLRLGPIRRQPRIAKATIDTELNHGEGLAQVVQVQFEQVCEQRAV